MDFSGVFRVQGLRTLRDLCSLRFNRLSVLCLEVDRALRLLRCALKEAQAKSCTEAHCCEADLGSKT